MIVLKSKGFEVRKADKPGALGLALEDVAAYLAEHPDATVEVYQAERLIGVYDRHNVPV